MKLGEADKKESASQECLEIAREDANQWHEKVQMLQRVTEGRWEGCHDRCEPGQAVMLTPTEQSEPLKQSKECFVGRDDVIGLCGPWDKQ